MANCLGFAKFAKVFPSHRFALYGSCTPSNVCSAGTTDAARTTGNAGNYGSAGASGTHGTTDTYKIMYVITIL